MTLDEVIRQMDDFAARYGEQTQPIQANAVAAIIANFRDALRGAVGELDEAAKHINAYLNEIPINPAPHNWLIRNGYRDESYQAGTYGQEVVHD